MADLLTISEVSRRSGVAASALRFYEEKGLIASVGRQGLRRVFDAGVLERLALIAVGRSAGFSLDEIARMFTSGGKPRIDRKLLADSDAIPHNASVYEDYYQLLKRAIDQLSPQKQRIVKLCKLEGKTYEEAAAEMKISRHTVKEYLSAAMASLSEYVRQHANKVSGMGCIV